MKIIYSLSDNKQNEDLNNINIFNIDSDSISKKCIILWSYSGGNYREKLVKNLIEYNDIFNRIFSTGTILVYGKIDICKQEGYFSVSSLFKDTKKFNKIFNECKSEIYKRHRITSFKEI